MARRRGKVSVRKQRVPTRRSDSRQLHKAISFRPVRLRRIPRDPPMTNHHVEKAARIPIRFLMDSNATSSGFIGSPGISFDIPVYVVKRGVNVKVPEPITLSTHQLAEVFGNLTGMKTDFGKALDLAVRKVTFWGPALGGNIKSPASIDFTLDLGNHTTGISISDIGTTMHRPAVGVTIPYLHWSESTDTTAIMKLQWDAGNKDGSVVYSDGRYEIGVAHISVLGRFVEES